MIRVVEKYRLSSFLDETRKRERKREKKNCEITIGSRSRETRDQMHILQEFSRPCIFSKLAFLRVIVTLYGFAYAFAIKVLYVSVLMPLISCLSLRVTCPLFVCARVSVTSVCRHTCASTRVHVSAMSACISVCSRVSFFFFLLSFFPLIIKVYFILQSLECAGNRQSVLFFSFLSLSFFLSSLSLLSSNRLALSFAFQERISTINRVRGNEETFSDFFQGFPTTDYAKIRDS